jgi:aminoglycoside phosphotransferase (APT) family kinase protein
MSAAVAAVTTSRRDILDIVNDPTVRLAVLGASRDANGKVTVLVLPHTVGRPRLAIKVPTTDAGAAAVTRERRMLDALHRLNSSVIESTAPFPAESLTAAGREAMVLTLLPGTPLTTLYHRWGHTRSPRRVARDLGAVAEWLARLHHETVDGDAHVDMDGGTVRRLAQRFAQDPELAAVVVRVERACAVLQRHRSPRTVVHGDLWCGNVLVRDGAVTGVVDWEEAELRGEPLRDLARFALTYALYLDRHTHPGALVAGHPGLHANAWGCGIDYLLYGNGWICDLLRAFLRLGMRRLGVPGELWREAVVAGVAEVAARADDEDFARAHLRVLARLATGTRPEVR